MKSKIYIQKPAEIPGAMILEEMKEKEIALRELDEFLAKLRKKNGITKY